MTLQQLSINIEDAITEIRAIYKKRKLNNSKSDDVKTYDKKKQKNAALLIAIKDEICDKYGLKVSTVSRVMGESEPSDKDR